MPNNDFADTEITTTLPQFRTLTMGGQAIGVLIHVTPEGYHVCDQQWDGICLVCGHRLDSR